MTIKVGQSGKPFEAELSGGIGVDVGGKDTPLGLNITHIPKIQIGLDKIEVGIDPLTLNLAIKEIPSIRAHFPANFSIGFTALGVKLFSIDLCGKAQLINEPFVPNRAERCGKKILQQAPRPPLTGEVQTPGERLFDEKDETVQQKAK